MADFLTAAYALRLKKIYKDEKDNIKKHIGESKIDNRKRLVKFSLPHVRKAYRMGVDFASYWVKIRKQLKKVPKVNYTITDKEKNILLRDFIQRLKFAEMLYKLKSEQLRELLRRQNIKRNVVKDSKEALDAIYLGEVKKAINILIANAGNTGKSKVINEHYG